MSIRIVFAIRVQVLVNVITLRPWEKPADRSRQTPEILNSYISHVKMQLDESMYLALCVDTCIKSVYRDILTRE